MPKHTTKQFTFPIKTAIVVGIVLVVAGINRLGFRNHNSFFITSAEASSFPQLPYNDSAASVAAFMGVYQVLMSPRCMNCHPAGDVPLQGEDSHLHTMNPKRGTEGKGIYAMKCANCHQDKNVEGVHTPPGNSNWHLPPANMKMVFEGRSPYELAVQLLDPAQNGNKTKAQLIEHVSHDSLVLGGWTPGDGRALPPISHEEFAKLFITWIGKGAYAPRQ